MKLTELKQIIREETKKILKEDSLSSDGEKFWSEMVSFLSSERYWARLFQRHFTDTSDFYKLPKEDRESILSDIKKEVIPMLIKTIRGK